MAARRQQAAAGNGHEDTTDAAATWDPTARALMIIAEAVRDPQCDAVKLEAVHRIHADLIAKANERIFNQAFTAMWAEIPQIGKEGKVDTGKGKYAFAETEDIDELVRPIMKDHGFGLSFRPIKQDQSGITIEGELIHHETGYAKRAQWWMPNDTGPGRNLLQAMGSAQTYAIRYLRIGMLDLVLKGADDDGRGYTGHTNKTASKEKEVDEPRDRPPVNWVEKIGALLDKAPSLQAWVTTLTSALPQAPSATELDQLRNALRGAVNNMHDRVSRSVVVKAFEDAAAKFAPKAAAKTEPPPESTPTEKPLDTEVEVEWTRDVNTKTADDQWADSIVERLDAIWDMNSFQIMAQDDDTQKRMKKYSIENRAIFDRIKTAFVTRQDFIAKEASK